MANFAKPENALKRAEGEGHNNFCVDNSTYSFHIQCSDARRSCFAMHKNLVVVRVLFI